jgi:hypothetical protein
MLRAYPLIALWQTAEGLEGTAILNILRQPLSWAIVICRTDKPLAQLSRSELVMQKIAPCLWFDDQAEEAAKFYVATFKKAKLGPITYYGEAGAHGLGKTEGFGHDRGIRNRWAGVSRS